jgi:hypothetical protein
MTDLELLNTYCRDRDVPCPSCGYNLRNTTSPTCPECGLSVSLGVTNAVPRVGPLAVAMVAVGVTIGFSLTMSVVGWVGLWRQSDDASIFADWGPVDWVAIGLLTAHGVLGLLAIRLIYGLRRRMHGWRRGNQWLFAIFLVLLAAGLQAALIYSVFAIITREWTLDNSLFSGGGMGIMGV